VIQITGLKTQFGKQVVHEIWIGGSARRGAGAWVGGSGTGKSVLLREIVGRQNGGGGRSTCCGTNVTHDGAEAQHALRQSWGVMFQEGALFQLADRLPEYPGCRSAN